MTTATRMTAEELLRLPNRGGQRHELVQGEVRSMTPAGGRHGWIAMRIGARLLSYVEAHRLGAVFAAETGFKIASNPDTVRAPDVAFVARERLARLELGRGYWPGAPDLVVEVVSPGDTYEGMEGGEA